MNTEHFAAILLLAAHVGIFLLTWRMKWRLDFMRWLIRLGMGLLAVICATIFLGDTVYGIQPYYVAACCVFLIFFSLTFFANLPEAVWIGFIIQTMMAGAFFWFIFFFRLTRLF